MLSDGGSRVFHISTIGEQSVCLPSGPESGVGVVDAGASVSTVGTRVGAGTGASVMAAPAR